MNNFHRKLSLALSQLFYGLYHFFFMGKINALDELNPYHLSSL